MTSKRLSDNKKFLLVVLDSVSLTKTLKVEVSICGLLKIYFCGGAGFSASTVKLSTKNSPSKISILSKVATPSTTGTVMSSGMANV